MPLTPTTVPVKLFAVPLDGAKHALPDFPHVRNRFMGGRDNHSSRFPRRPGNTEDLFKAVRANVQLTHNPTAYRFAMQVRQPRACNSVTSPTDLWTAGDRSRSPERDYYSLLDLTPIPHLANHCTCDTCGNSGAAQKASGRGGATRGYDAVRWVSCSAGKRDPA